MKNAVVFGGMGFIGLHYAKYLLNQKKYNFIYLIDISEPKGKYSLNVYQNLILNSSIKFIKKDVRKDLTDINISKVDIICDFAAVHREPGHSDNEYFETNVEGSKNICNFADYVKCVNIIFTSSISVYGPGNHEKNENTKTFPTTAYGKSKLEAEKNYIHWQNKNKSEKILTICRPGVVFGPGENGNVSRLIKSVKKRFFIFMGNKYLKKSGIYINELISSISWVNENQILKKFKNITLFNGSFHPCPDLENYVSAISNQFQNINEFLTVPKIIIKTIIVLTSFITKNLSPLSNYHYKRLNKLFRSNFVTPQFLVNSNYKFNYNLNSSMQDWKKNNSDDW